MRIERLKNASRNVAHGIALQMLKLIAQFAMRSVIIQLLGVEYLGLNSLFTSLLSVLNLAELGVGSAMVYSMYKPIAEDDGYRICALMRLYRTYYRIIGIVVCALGVLLLPFVPHLISGEVPAGIDVYALYLLNLSATVVSYWLFAYKNSILLAHQRNDVVSRVSFATESVKYALQVLVLFLFRDYYLYVIAILATQILNNVLTSVLAGRMYPQYCAQGTLPKSEHRAINQRIRDLFTAKVGTVVVYSADTIVISAFLGLTTLAIYQNYYLVFVAATSLVSILFSSVQAGLGNSIVLDTKEKVFSDFKVFLLVIVWIVGLFSACLLCLYQPFMELWVGESLLMDFGVVALLSAYFYIHCLNVFLNSYKDAAGMWHVDRFRPLVEAGLNLSLNLVLVQVVGLHGIVISTIASMIAVAPWLIRNLFSLVFERSQLKGFLSRLLFYVVVSAFAIAGAYFACSLVDQPPALSLAMRLCICFLVVNSLFFCVYSRLPEFAQCLRMVSHVVKSKLGKAEEAAKGRQDMEK